MRLAGALRRFARAKRGLAALEFAILAPMMIFLLFGAVDLLDVLGANRRVQNVAASLADVVSRDTEISNQEIAGLWDAVDVLMFPEAGDAVRVRITSIRVENATTARVVWSDGRNLSPRTANSVIALPPAMMNPGTSIILAETEYTYRSPIGFVVAGPLTLQHEAYRRSRLVDPIPRVA